MFLNNLGHSDSRNFSNYVDKIDSRKKGSVAPILEAEEGQGVQLPKLNTNNLDTIDSNYSTLNKHIPDYNSNQKKTGRSAKNSLPVNMFSPAIRRTFEKDTRKLKAALNDHGLDSYLEKTRFTINIFQNLKRESIVKEPAAMANIKKRRMSVRNRVHVTMPLTTKANIQSPAK